MAASQDGHLACKWLAVAITKDLSMEASWEHGVITAMI